MELREAQRLSDVEQLKLSGEVLQAQAVVQIDRDRLAEAADLSSKV